MPRPRLVFQSCLPAVFRQSRATSSPSSLVTKIRSPQMTGVEPPMPGIGAVQAMFLLVDHLTGRFFSALMPSRVGAAPLRPILSLREAAEAQCRDYRETDHGYLIM